MQEPIKLSLLLLLLVLLVPSITRADTPFANFTINSALIINKEKTHADKLVLSGKFQLGRGSDRANPLTDTVKLNVGPFSQTLPPGTFTLKSPSPKNTNIWTLNKKKGSSDLRDFTISKPGEQWTFSVIAAGITLAGTKNPIAVTLVLGNDNGTLSQFFAVTDKKKKTLLKYLRGKTTMLTTMG